MAWLVKNSAAATIDHRPDPYLDDAMKADIEQTIIPRYPTRRAATLPVLHQIQNKHNWLPHQALEETASFLGAHPSEILDTASFYEMFWLKPKGKYLILVCQSIACEIRGHHELIEKLQTKLGIEIGQTTPDAKFTLMHTECLGSCGSAPCALLNDKLHENLTPENLDRVLDSLP
jgi:NADH-quinone oxidoreductase subunit E